MKHTEPRNVNGTEVTDHEVAFVRQFGPRPLRTGQPSDTFPSPKLVVTSYSLSPLPALRRPPAAWQARRHENGAVLHRPDLYPGRAPGPETHDHEPKLCEHSDRKIEAMADAAPAFRRDRPRMPAAERRRQIIDVATSLIADRGFWGVSMQDIADRCGLTVPGLLRHMESKVGLLIAVLEHRDVEDARSLRTHLATSEDAVPDDWANGGPTGVDLRRLCAATMQRNATQPEMVRLFTVLAAESLEPTHPAHDYFARRQEQAAAAYAALAKHLTDRPELLARQIMAMMDGLQLHWLRNPETTDLTQEWEAAAETLFAGLTA